MATWAYPPCTPRQSLLIIKPSNHILDNYIRVTRKAIQTVPFTELFTELFTVVLHKTLQVLLSMLRANAALSVTRMFP